MSEKNIISNNPFSINVPFPKKTLREIKKVAEKEFKNLTGGQIDDYLSENDRVFSGEVAKEIRKYQSQIYSLGQVMREGQVTRTFKRNV